MTTRDDNLRFLRRRAAEPALDDGPIRTQESGETLLVEFQSKERLAELLRAAADWLDRHSGASVIALNVQYIDDPDDPQRAMQHLLEMVIEG